MIYKTAYRDRMGNHRTRFDVGEVHPQTFFRASTRREVPRIIPMSKWDRDIRNGKLAPRLVPKVFRTVTLGEFKTAHNLS